MFPGLPRNRGTRQRLSASRRGDFFDPGTVLPAQARTEARHPGRLSPTLHPPVQPLKAEPRSGLGRLPSASRVHACEAQPRAPHPTGLGYPAPAKLALCPTSVTPLEAPLTGQDAVRIRQVLGCGITIQQDLMLMNEILSSSSRKRGPITTDADVARDQCTGDTMARKDRSEAMGPRLRGDDDGERGTIPPARGRQCECGAAFAGRTLSMCQRNSAASSG